MHQGKSRVAWPEVLLLRKGPKRPVSHHTNCSPFDPLASSLHSSLAASMFIRLLSEDARLRRPNQSVGEARCSEITIENNKSNSAEMRMTRFQIRSRQTCSGPAPVSGHWWTSKNQLRQGRE